MPSNEHIVLDIDGVRTLPLYSMIAETKETIPRFGSGKVEFVYREPQLDPSPFRCDYHSLARASKNWDFAGSATSAWQKYANGLICFQSRQYVVLRNYEATQPQRRNTLQRQSE